MVPSAANSAFPDPKDLPSRPELPDPLVMLDGTKVATKEQWVEKRRPELKDLFQHYMYGTIPAAEGGHGQGRARGREGVRRQGDAARGQPVGPAQATSSACSSWFRTAAKRRPRASSG